jgi:hypothetical protein
MANAPDAAVFCFLFDGTGSLSAFFLFAKPPQGRVLVAGWRVGGWTATLLRHRSRRGGLKKERMSVHECVARMCVPWLPPLAAGVGCMTADGDTPGPVVGVSVGLSVANVVALVVCWRIALLAIGMLAEAVVPGGTLELASVADAVGLDAAGVPSCAGL